MALTQGAHAQAGRMFPGRRGRSRVRLRRASSLSTPIRAEPGEGRGEGNARGHEFAPTSTQSSLSVSAGALGTFAAVATVVVSTASALYWTYVTNEKVANIEEKVNRADVALFGVRAGVPNLEGKVSREPTPGLVEQVAQIQRTQQEMQRQQQEMQRQQQEMQRQQQEMQREQQEMKQTQQEILQRLPPARSQRR